MRKTFTWLDRLVFRLTARRWNRLIISVLSRNYRLQGARLTLRQFHILAAEFDPTQNAAYKRIRKGEIRKEKEAL